ncbi:MFS transporter [Leucobacter sp. CSA1]|uniref:MFS transporter n=1 Tax=Leucobacter chromiisoli TaxID=2796471 RepID=A0A934Q628_9MICO|nr:MFS transporter [Leucobacter chromiisoli]MBK0418316.1 MFS transporter [Leucobacter chromiisoli]
MRTAAPSTIWDRAWLGITIGSVALIFLAATEALAVTTVMPVVSVDLHGQALFAVAFSGTLATGVIGMVAAGAWSDRTGPRAPLYTAVLLFTIGLVVSGVAADMYTLIAGRLIQGLGGGAQTVSLYVLVARVYPRELHGRIFAAFAAAWVVPSMIGPFLAGAVTEFLHWRWTFLGVAVLTALAFLLVFAQLRGASLGAADDGAADVGTAADDDGTTGAGGAGDGRASDGTDAVRPPSGRAIAVRLLLSVVVALAAVATGFAAEAPPAVGWPIALGCIAVIACAIRPLTPRGTLSSRAGLPSVILMRGLVAGSFLAAETYVPKLLMDRFAFSPTIAGLALTVAALAWSLASFAQGRYGDRVGSMRLVMLGLPLLLVGIVALLAVAVTDGTPWLVVAGWGVAGGGMGLLYPRLTVLTLSYSTTADEGFNSSALSISDSTGSAVAIAVAGLVFLTLPVSGSGFTAVFVLAAAVLLVSLIPGLRLGDGRR